MGCRGGGREGSGPSEGAELEGGVELWRRGFVVTSGCGVTMA